MNLLSLALGSKAAEMISQLQEVVKQGSAQRGAELFLQIEREYPALSNIIKDFVFKSPEEAARTFYQYTQIRLDVKLVAEIQEEIKKKRFKR